MPYSSFEFPVDNHATFHGSTHNDVIEVFAFLKLSSDEDVPVLIASNTIRYDVTIVACHSCFDGPAPIVDDKGVLLYSR